MSASEGRAPMNARPTKDRARRGYESAVMVAPPDNGGRPRGTGRRAAHDLTEAYAVGFSAGWADRAEYERRTKFAGDDYLSGYRDGLAAAGGAR